MVRRLGAFVAALVAVMLIAIPVFAADLTNPTPIPWNSTGFECDADDLAELAELGIVLGEGDVVWHFVSPGGDETSRLTVDFSGTTDDASGLVPQKVTNGTAHWWIVTGETTLEGAFTTGPGDSLQLSHICVGGPPPIIPEAPVAILLPAGLLAAFAAFFLIRRRQTALDAA